MRILVRCVPLLRGDRRHIVVFFGLSVVFGLMMAAFALAFAPVLWEGVLQGRPVSELGAAVFGLDPARVVHVETISADARIQIMNRLSSPLVLGLVVPLAALAGALTYYYVWILQRVNQRLRLELIDRLQALSLRFHHSSRIGDAIYRTYQDSAMVTQLISVLFLVPLGSLLQFVGALLLVAAFHPALALALLVLVPPLVLLGGFFSRRLRVRFRGARESNSALTSSIQESLAGIKVIKAYGLESFERDRFAARSREAFDRAFRARGLLAVFGVTVFWILGVGLIAGTLWSTLATREASELWVHRVAAGTRLGDWLATAGFSIWALGWYNLFKGAFSGGTGGLNALYKMWGRAQDVVIGLDRVFEVLDLEPEVRDAPGALTLAGLRESVVFRDVNFGYQADRPVLSDLSLEAHCGQITALVGPTGSGKSTMMALLLRLFDPDAGRIEIDGVDLRQLKLESVRACISIALQENVLFAASVRENIRYVAPRASDAAVREAARVACADGFIEQLSDGYDTDLGERGARLSTGQRQRITIARAIVKDTPILVLDEPTSALDAETEHRLIRNLAEWGRGRCVFLITHRLSTIRMADQIVFLGGGRIVEKASHDELMARPDGAYRGLVESERTRRAEVRA